MMRVALAAGNAIIAPPRRRFARALGAVALLAAATLLAGCVTPPAPRVVSATDTGPWAGRLSITVESRPPQRFYAGFTLEGSADAGQLALTSPLGNTLAELRWQPGRAELDRGGQVQTYASLDELIARATGTPLPVRALFDWLRGQNTAADGWQANLGALAQGQLSAQRYAPPPAAQLRIALDP